MTSQSPISTHPIAIIGIRIATSRSGMRYRDRDDLALFEIANGSKIAAVFTRNKFCAAPVILAQQYLSQTRDIKYLIINAGNANAGTGADGLQRVQAYCDSLAKITGVNRTSILPFSTGVIGVPINVDAIVSSFPALLEGLREDSWENAAHAIMTTDTVSKCFSCILSLGGKDVSIIGIAKGSGMIHPNMATMLAFIATDIDIEQSLLQSMLNRYLEGSFNSISVDGDTSTNDACVCVATGGSGVGFHSLNDEECSRFSKALLDVMRALSHAIVRDGEGASKFIEIHVEGAGSDADAKEIANTVATSPLVKTAMAASDANWGRIIAAIGRARIARLDIDHLCLSINGVRIWENNALCRDYTEEQGMRAMAEKEIRVHIKMCDGSGSATVWTSDLTVEYVRINADYRS